MHYNYEIIRQNHAKWKTAADYFEYDWHFIRHDKPQFVRNRRTLKLLFSFTTATAAYAHCTQSADTRIFHCKQALVQSGSTCNQQTGHISYATINLSAIFSKAWQPNRFQKCFTQALGVKMKDSVCEWQAICIASSIHMKSASEATTNTLSTNVEMNTMNGLTSHIMRTKHTSQQTTTNAMNKNYLERWYHSQYFIMSPCKDVEIANHRHCATKALSLHNSTCHHHSNNNGFLLLLLRQNAPHDFVLNGNMSLLSLYVSSTSNCRCHCRALCAMCDMRCACKWHLESHTHCQRAISSRKRKYLPKSNRWQNEPKKRLTVGKKERRTKSQMGSST